MASEQVCPICGVFLTAPYIKCSECKDPEWSFCLQCFAKGSEYENHKNNHGYSIVRNNFPIFEPTWMASEELKLLDAIITYGLGNWAAVSKMVGTKSKQECEQHYFVHYVNNPKPPLQKFPDPVVKESYSSPIPYATSYDPPRPSLFSPLYNDMAGYVVTRGDFCTEFDDYAEYDIKDVNIEEEDPILSALQNTVVHCYRLRLQERYRRKALMKRYALISAQRNVDEWRRYNVLGRDVVEKLKQMMRLLKPIEFDEFMEGIICEAKIKHRIKLLQECREAGVSKLQDVGTYVKLKKSREGAKKTKSVLDEVLSNIRKGENSRNHFIRKQALKENDDVINALSLSTRRSAPPLCISGLPGYDALTQKERDLCASLRLLPSSFLLYKSTLLHEYNKLGYLRLANARSVIKIDVNKTRKIYDFLLEEGIIRK